MTKQTIEIDVPDGCEVCYEPSYGKEGIPNLTIRIKQKEHKYIEMREYISKIHGYGNTVRVALRIYGSEDDVLPEDGIRWIGHWHRAQV